MAKVVLALLSSLEPNGNTVLNCSCMLIGFVGTVSVAFLLAQLALLPMSLPFTISFIFSWNTGLPIPSPSSMVSAVTTIFSCSALRSELHLRFLPLRATLGESHTDSLADVSWPEGVSSAVSTSSSCTWGLPLI